MRRLLFFCLAALAPLASGQDSDAEEIDGGLLDERRLESLEAASGFIVDRTITQFGAEFVRVFSQAWRSQPGTGELEVTIIERPTARFGSLVWIEHNQRPIARAFLYAGRSATIQPVAVAAADYVAKKLADEALAGLLFDDPDLAKEGF